MSKKKTVSVEFHSGFLTCLTLVFIILKLTGIVEWSWWWIFSPLWVPMAMTLAVALLFIVALGIGWIIDTNTKREQPYQRWLDKALAGEGKGDESK